MKRAASAEADLLSVHAAQDQARADGQVEGVERGLERHDLALGWTAGAGAGA